MELMRLCPSASTCPSKVEGECKNETHRCLRPRSQSQLVSDSLADTLRLAKCISFTYNPVTSQTAAFALGPWMSESMHEALRSMDRSFVAFQSQTFLRPHLSSARPKVRCPMWDTNLSLLREKLWTYEDGPCCVSPCWEGIWGKTLSLPLLPV